MIDITQLDWQKTDDLIPVIVQDAMSSVVLMLGYMNKEALNVTLATKRVTFYSRTKQRLWTKGETSGNFLELIKMSADCDNDSILVLAKPIGPTCHLQTQSCFNNLAGKISFMRRLEQHLCQRKDSDPTTSYTAKLFSLPTKRVAQKVGEEGVETALAACVNDNAELSQESADLLYHLIVLLNKQGLSLADVITVLQQRATGKIDNSYLD